LLKNNQNGQLNYPKSRLITIYKLTLAQTLIYSMKYFFTTLTLISALTISQGAFAQAKKFKMPALSLLAPPIDPIGDNPGGGGYSPPPVYGRFISNGGSHSSGNAIFLWEGNNCTQDEVIRHVLANDNSVVKGSYKDLYSGSNVFVGAAQVLFGVGPNDEARSISVQGVKAGRVIEFYDSPNAYKDDDWVEILFKQDIHSFDLYQIDTFEKSYEDAYVRVTFHSHNGLDGKVSYINSYLSN
jgi:hypothetical protein